MCVHLLVICTINAIAIRFKQLRNKGQWKRLINSIKRNIPLLEYLLHNNQQLSDHFSCLCTKLQKVDVTIHSASYQDGPIAHKDQCHQNYRYSEFLNFFSSQILENKSPADKRASHCMIMMDNTLNIINELKYPKSYWRENLLCQKQLCHFLSFCNGSMNRYFRNFACFNKKSGQIGKQGFFQNKKKGLNRSNSFNALIKVI